MKTIIAIILCFSMATGLCASQQYMFAFNEPIAPHSVSDTSKATDLDRYPTNPHQMNWKDWVWVGVIFVVSGIAVASAYRTRRPI